MTSPAAPRRSRRMSAAPLPTGRVTFLFADIEGSTRLARSLSADDWAAVLERHDQLADAIIAAHSGNVVKHEGDGTFAVFAAASDALDVAATLSAAIAHEPWPADATVRLRIGLHTGEGRLTADARDYVGLDVHYAARLAAAGNGRQVVLSDDARGALTRALPGDAAIVSAGPRRLKDFDEPRPVHRLVIPGVADDERPLRTLGGADLPEVLTSFVGREAEVAAVSGFVDGSRIVTLTGPGGTGKTRLALSVADVVRGRFPDGVVFVELAPVRDPGLVLGVIAASVGVAEIPGQSVFDVLRDGLADRGLLLVLDNLEQLLPEAAGLVANLVRGAPRLHVLISSREPLRIGGEQEYPVPPLGSTDALALFEDRARLVRPDFVASPADEAAIAGIAARVAGLPLAIELAAARVRLFSPPVILDRLSQSLELLSAGARDLPERQRTLRATIGWSYDLLSPPEQVLFRRLAVLASDWTPEAAATITDPDGALGVDVLDGLASLVDKSLLRTVPTDHGDIRFGRHVFVREFAAEQLTAAGERPGCERRHAETFRDLAIDTGRHLTERGSERYLDLIDHSIHDLRQAMAWSLETGDVEIGLRIVGSAWRWWQLRTHLREGLDWATRLLAHPAAAGDTQGRVEALAAAGGLAYWSTDYGLTRSAYEERLAIAGRLGDRRLLAEAHYDLGFVGVIDQDLELLQREAGLAVDLFREVGDESGVIRARQAQVLAYFLAGDHVTAKALEEQNLADFQRTQSGYRVSDSFMLLGAIHRLAGDPEAALASARQAFNAMPERMGGSTIGALGVIAIIEGESGDAELAARLTGAIRSIQAETGEALAPVTVLHLPDPADVVRARLGNETADRLMAEGAKLSADEAIELALGGSPVEAG